MSVFARPSGQPSHPDETSPLRQLHNHQVSVQIVVSVVAIGAGIVVLAIPADTLLHVTRTRPVDRRRSGRQNHANSADRERWPRTAAGRRLLIARLAIIVAKGLLLAFLAWWIVELVRSFMVVP